MYGKTLKETNGFSLVEVLSADGTTVVGYAILDPAGNEIVHFATREEAEAELERLTEDNNNPPPRPPKPKGSNDPSPM